jgi:hypothetical protein
MQASAVMKIQGKGDVVIRMANNRDREQVVALVASILSEYGLPHDPESKDSDLKHLEENYIQSGGRKFMNVLFRRPQNSPNSLCQVEEFYWFWKYEVSTEGLLTVWELEDEPIRLAIEDGKLKGRIRKASLELDDSSENILAYFLSNEGEKAFHIYGQLKKIR